MVALKRRTDKIVAQNEASNERLRADLGTHKVWIMATIIAATALIIGCYKTVKTHT